MQTRGLGRPSFRTRTSCPVIQLRAGRSFSADERRPASSSKPKDWSSQRRSVSYSDDRTTLNKQYGQQAQPAAGRPPPRGRSYGEQDGRSRFQPVRQVRDVEDEEDASNQDEDEHWDQEGQGFERSDDGHYERAPNIRDQLVEDVLYGVFPVLNALKTKKRKLHALYVLSSLDLSKRKDAAAMRDIFKLAKELELPIHKAPRHELNLLSDDRPHQGLVLDCSGLQWGTMDTLPTAAAIAASQPNAAPPVWLALDEVMDPQNFGAVVRSAHCLGASGILACSRNCAPLSPAVSKASAGVLEVTQVHSCQNMVKTLTQAVADGWDVLGAVAGPQARECRSIKVTKPTIVVVGNEGSGLRTNVKRSCSGFVKVEMGLPRQQLAADSLNVSVAAGILMHALLGSAAQHGAVVSAEAKEAAAPQAQE